MTWDIDFISKEDFTNHVRATIQKYGDKLKSFDLKRFNKNIIDPVKLIFDKTVYRDTWTTTLGNEIFRQRDKSNNNDIGYFHQRIFQYIDNCTVPLNGEQGGWDVIFRPPEGIAMPDGFVVHTVYVEMKNKHNTMNSASSAKTFIKMQTQLLNDDDCACFLVEAIARKSQNVKWEPSVDGRSVGHRLIRRVSMDQFYALVTGEANAFYKICLALPEVIQHVVDTDDDTLIPRDTVDYELQALADDIRANGDFAFVLAVYMLGFPSYQGFRSLLTTDVMQKIQNDGRLSDYTKHLLQFD